MKWDEIKIRWLEYRPLAKRHWLALSDEQLDAIDGQRQLLSQSLQASYGVSHDIAELQIDTWATTFDDEEHESRRHEPAVGDLARARKPPLESPELRRRTNPRR